MKVLFICSSLEPGYDGVGDYTRKLSSALMKKAYHIAMLSLNDKYITHEVTDTQIIEDSVVQIMRLPASWPLKKRFSYAKKYIENFQPKWISLQYVPFGFHYKGLPFWLPGFLNKLGQNVRWHIMCHELWVGASASDSLKHKFLGMLQKYIFTELIKCLSPCSVFTSNGFYQYCLLKEKIQSDKVPIFSNLPVGNKVGKNLYNQLPEQIRIDRSNYVIATFFGGINDSDINKFVDKIEKIQSYAIGVDKKLYITHIGYFTPSINLLETIQNRTGIKIYAFGACHSQDIADYFCQIDFGISTYSKELFEKSGSIAAFLNNNLPVILLKDMIFHEDRNLSYVKEVNELHNFQAFLVQLRNFGNPFGVDSIAETYRECLQ